jgi:hypothetical protein
MVMFPAPMDKSVGMKPSEKDEGVLRGCMNRSISVRQSAFLKVFLNKLT